jgi:5-(carboxyamino)imidazole ribonucleotide synthase
LLGYEGPVAPSAACVSVAQDRLAEKHFFTRCGTHTGVYPAPHWGISSVKDIAAVKEELLPGILKTVRMGYDGKGQIRVNTREELSAAFDTLKHQTRVLKRCRWHTKYRCWLRAVSMVNQWFIRLLKISTGTEYCL